jgi:signal transduction histidine kinase
MAEMTRLLRETPRAWRQRIVHVMTSPSFQVSITPENLYADAQRQDWRAELLRQFLVRAIGTVTSEDVMVQWIGGDDDPQDTSMLMSWMRAHMAQMMIGTVPEHSVHVSIRLADGRLDSGGPRDQEWVNFRAGFGDTRSLWSSQAVVSTILMTLAVALLSFWVVRRMTRPLRAFARAAEHLGRDVSAPPLEERGPVEVRQAIHAFNDMQMRLQRLIENRTRMLAAISHDLKTPITLLRLRAESITDEEEKRRTCAILDEMEAMIASTLAFARDDAAQEERRTVDLAALVGSVCDDFADSGHDVTFEDLSPVKYRCGPLGLKRAVTNIVENAIKYAGSARAFLAISPGAVEIVVDDNGPGIPETQMEDVFAPFYRIEGSRSRETGGVGLGLSVARTIVHAHGGEIVLRNRPEGGLRTVIHLPR